MTKKRRAEIATQLSEFGLTNVRIAPGYDENDSPTLKLESAQIKSEPMRPVKFAAYVQGVTDAMAAILDLQPSSAKEVKPPTKRKTAKR